MVPTPKALRRNARLSRLQASRRRFFAQVSALLIFVLLASFAVRAQDNYEIQVYGADTVAPGETMIELHSNFTLSGSKHPDDGTLPTNHALHETIEITQGINSWFEVGFYIFTSARNGSGWDWVGDHIRPRARVPEKWHWPVGVSISNEIGYQRSKFSPNTWTWEIRPIVDKEFKRWYLAFNPTIDKSFKGPDAKRGFEFSPNFKVGYAFTKKISGGIEYYGALGPIGNLDPLREQQQQVFPSIDLNVSPKWEFNFGVGVGMTRNTDHLIVKMILGRRFKFTHRSRKTSPSP
jgi:hypothetical protein